MKVKGNKAIASAKILLKNSTIYVTVSVLNGAIGFLLLPIITRYLNPTEYGIIIVVSSITSVLSILYIFPVRGLVRFFFDYKDDAEKTKELFGTNVLFIIIISGIFTLLLLLFHEFLLEPFAKGINFYPFLLLGLIRISLNPLYLIYNNTLRIRHLGWHYGLNNLSFFIIKITLIIISIIPLRLGAAGYLLSEVITESIFLIYSFIRFRPEIKFTINKKILTDSLKYSLLFIPHSLSGWVMLMIDKVFLNNIKSASVAGIYNIGFMFGGFINFFSFAINQAFVPWFFENMKIGDDGKKRIVMVSEYITVFYCLLALGISFFGKEVLTIMVTGDYKEGWKVINFISFAFVFNGIYYFFVKPLIYNKKGPKYVSIITFLSAFINITLNIILIPDYGMVGASIASLISMFVLSMLALYFSNRIEYVPYTWLKIYFITFGMFFISLFTFMVDKFDFYHFFILKILIFLILVLILFIYYKNELKLILEIISRKEASKSFES